MEWLVRVELVGYVEAETEDEAVEAAAENPLLLDVTDATAEPCDG